MASSGRVSTSVHRRSLRPSRSVVCQPPKLCAKLHDGRWYARVSHEPGGHASTTSDDATYATAATKSSSHEPGFDASETAQCRPGHAEQCSSSATRPVLDTTATVAGSNTDELTAAIRRVDNATDTDLPFEPKHERQWSCRHFDTDQP